MPRNIKEEDKPCIPEIPDGFSDVFLFNAYPPESWKNELETQQDYKGLDCCEFLKPPYIN